MEVSEIAGIFLAAILLLIYALFKIPVKRRVPPEVGGGWPLIGHLHLLGANKDQPTHTTLGKMADIYGPIFTLRLGMKRALIVSNWEVAKECFTTNDKVFASRPKLVASKLLGYDNAMLGLTPYGPYWRHMRKITTFELLTNRRLEQLQPIRKSEVESLIKKLHELCVSKNNNQVLVGMNRLFEDTILNIVFRMVVGKGFVTTSDGCGNNEEFRKAWKNFFEWFGIFVPSDGFPFLSWFDFGGHEKGMKTTAKVLNQVYDKWIKEHREMKNSDRQDFIDVMLSVVKDSENVSNYDDDTIIKATCSTIILAGSESTTSTMIWALSLLLNNPKVLTKVQHELDEQVGKEREVKESDIKNLTYLHAVLKETLRLYPAGPLLLPHESIEDCTVAGYHIPAKTLLMINAQKLQRDPNVWEDPSEFRPERFLTTHRDVDFRGQSLQLIPFGSGRRMCPGIQFALQIMHLTLASLLHEFEIDRPSKELLNMEESVGITGVKKSPLQAVLSPRLPAKAYE